MEVGLYQLVERILTVTLFIAIGGGLVVIFTFVFAQSITGSKITQKRLASIEKQLNRISEQLEKIANSIDREGEK